MKPHQNSVLPDSPLSSLIFSSSQSNKTDMDLGEITALLLRLKEVMLATKPVFTIEEFCTAHGITKPHYYTLKKQGMGPREMVVGRRRLITQEAAADWRRDREQDTKGGHK